MTKLRFTAHAIRQMARGMVPTIIGEHALRALISEADDDKKRGRVEAQKLVQQKAAAIASLTTDPVAHKKDPPPSHENFKDTPEHREKIEKARAEHEQALKTLVSLMDDDDDDDDGGEDEDKKRAREEWKKQRVVKQDAEGDREKKRREKDELASAAVAGDDDVVKKRRDRENTKIASSSGDADASPDIDEQTKAARAATADMYSAASVIRGLNKKETRTSEEESALKTAKIDYHAARKRARDASAEITQPPEEAMAAGKKKIAPVSKGDEDVEYTDEDREKAASGDIAYALKKSSGLGGVKGTRKEKDEEGNDVDVDTFEPRPEGNELAKARGDITKHMALGAGKKRKTPPGTETITKSQLGKGGGWAKGDRQSDYKTAAGLKRVPEEKRVAIGNLKNILRDDYARAKAAWDRGYRPAIGPDDPPHSEPQNAGELLELYLDDQPIWSTDPETGQVMPLEKRGKLYNYGDKLSPAWVFIPTFSHAPKLVWTGIDRRGKNPAVAPDWQTLDRISAKQRQRFIDMGVPIDDRDRANIEDDKTAQYGVVEPSSVRPPEPNVRGRGAPAGENPVGQLTGHIPAAEPAGAHGGGAPSRDALKAREEADRLRGVELPDPEGMTLDELKDWKQKLEDAYAGATPSVWKDPNAARQFAAQQREYRELIAKWAAGELRDDQGRLAPKPDEPKMPGRAAAPRERSPEIRAFEKKLDAAIIARGRGVKPKKPFSRPSFKDFEDDRLQQFTNVVSRVLKQNPSSYDAAWDEAQRDSRLSDHVKLLRSLSGTDLVKFNDFMKQELERRRSFASKKPATPEKPKGRFVDAGPPKEKADAPKEKKGDVPADPDTTYRAKEKSEDAPKVGKDQGSKLHGDPDDQSPTRTRHEDQGFTNRPKIRNPSDLLGGGKKKDDEDGKK